MYHVRAVSEPTPVRIPRNRRLISEGNMRSLVIIISTLSAMPAVASGGQHGHAHVQTEVRSDRTGLVRASYEASSGLTYEAVGGTKGVEGLIGWSFHPSDSLTVATLGGADVEGNMVEHLIPFVLVRYEAEELKGEWWNIAFVERHHLPHFEHTAIYQRLWATWHGVGPFLEGEFPLNGVGAGVVGATVVHEIASPLSIQLSGGALAGEHQGAAARLYITWAPK